MESRHFAHHELVCRCGCGLNNATAELLELAEKCRAILDAPMVVHSACRCPDHNKAMGGTAGSNHTKGKAMDFHAVGLQPEAAYKVLMEYQRRGYLPQLGGIGLYDWGLHIDTQKAADGHLRTWDYRSKK